MNAVDWQVLPFEEAIDDITAEANKVDQSQFLGSGKYPIVDQGQNFIAGYLDDDSLIWKRDLPVIIFGDHTRAIKYVDFPFVLGADGTKVLKPIADIFPKFAYFALLSINIPSAGYSRHFKFIKETTLRFPPLPEQRRLAALLDRADRLRRLRRYALELSETYLQSVFMEMFGDPVRNDKRWERAQISDLSEVQTGNTPSRERPEYYGDYIEWIKSDNIVDGEMYISQSREMLSEEGLKQGRFVEAHSVLVTCIAGSLTSVGDVALTNRRVAFNQQINALTPVDDVDSVFLYGLLKAAQPLIQYNASAGMKHIITKSRLEELTLIKPPFGLQQKFAEIAVNFERLRTQQREALRQAEMLFGALLKRAFEGEV